MESRQLLARHIDPLELSPGKFAHLVRTAVEDGIRTVIVDSLTGYMAAMGDEASLMLQLRNLLTYLGEHNVTTLLVSVQHGLMGPVDAPAGHVSYLADTVILLRYYEHGGEVRRAVSVFKRRAGAHEHTIRDIDFTPTGISVGPPLRHFRGVLTGVPEFQSKRGRDDGGPSSTLNMEWSGVWPSCCRMVLTAPWPTRCWRAPVWGGPVCSGGRASRHCGSGGSRAHGCRGNPDRNWRAAPDGFPRAAAGMVGHTPHCADHAPPGGDRALATDRGDSLGAQRDPA